MTIRLKKNASREELAEVIKKANHPTGKGFDASKYFGKMKWEQDPVAYQRDLRGNP